MTENIKVMADKVSSLRADHRVPTSFDCADMEDAVDRADKLTAEGASKVRIVEGDKITMWADKNAKAVEANKEDAPETPPAKALKAMNVAELTVECEARDIEYGDSTKKEAIALIEAYDSDLEDKADLAASTQDDGGEVQL